MSLADNIPRCVWWVWTLPIACLISALACLIFVFAWKAFFAKDIEANVCGNDIKIYTPVYEAVKSLQEVLKLETAYKAANLSATKNNCMAANQANKRYLQTMPCDTKEIEQLSRLLDEEKKGLEKVDDHLQQLQVHLQESKTRYSREEKKN